MALYYSINFICLQSINNLLLLMVSSYYHSIPCKWIILLILFQFGLSSHTKGQMLTKEVNSFRVGDWVDKVRVEYHEQFDGNRYVWTIDKLEDNARQSDSYKLLKDTICCVRKGVRTYFSQDEHKIGILGYESNLFSVKYKNPEVYVRFPMSKGSVIDGNFAGEGTYCDKVWLRHIGTYHTEVLKNGCIVTELGDTIANVLLLATQRSNMVYYDSFQVNSGKSTRFKEIIYRWYAEGYRYPVMYSRKVYNDLFDEEKSEAPTYYYPLQYKEDISSLQGAEYIDKDRTGSGKSFSYRASMIGNVINVEYVLSFRTTVKGLLVDSKGCLYKTFSQSHDAGSYSFSMNCSGLPMGQYVLYLEANGEKYTQNFLID